MGPSAGDRAVRGAPAMFCRSRRWLRLFSMSDADDSVPDELEEELDDLAEELREPDRRNRTIEDQGVEGSIESENESSDTTAGPSE